MKALSARLIFRSLFLQAGFSDERRQGLGFAWIMDPALADAYGADGSGLRAARLRQLGAFNAQPNAACLVVGACAALEARSARGDAAAVARANSFKTSIAAALSGSADAFFWGALRPLAAATAAVSAAVAFRRGAPSPLLVSAVAGLLVFNVPAFTCRVFGVERGLSDPEAAVRAATALPVQRWIRILRLTSAVFIFAAVGTLLGGPLLKTPAALAAGAFALGAAATRAAGGPLRLVAAAGLLAAAAAAAGWTL